MKLSPGYSIVIPVYNEADIIQANTLKLRDYMKQLGYEFEIIIASNGSTDATCKLGAELAHTYPEIIFLHTNQRGAGISFKQAILCAQYENIISVDMDLSVELGFIARAIEHLSYYTIVIGCKKTSQHRPLYRRMLSSWFVIITKLLLGLSYSDYSMAAKGYKTEFLLKHLDCIDSGTSYVINMIYVAVKTSELVIEIPVRCDDTRVSKFNIGHEAIYRLAKLIEKLREQWK